MFQALYIEEEIINHPRVLSLKKRFHQLPQIICNKYTEVFNRKHQNFRLQKENYSLILAKKQGNFILATPPGYGIGGLHNFYFSHMLNCPFDCRYCFLQGMYRSAHIVLFINFEDFATAISEKSSEPTWFFSGYDADSLALENISGFAQYFLPFFEKQSKAYLELRTKSVSISSLLKHKALPNVVVAFSLSPPDISKTYEHKTPSFASRLQALEQLKNSGWKLGLRFDPLIYCSDFKRLYHDFFYDVFQRLPRESIHSVTFGSFRLPPHFYKNMVSLYPEEKLFSLGKRGHHMSYPIDIEEDLLTFCEREILKYLPKEAVFPCIEKQSLSQVQAAELAKQ